MSDRTTKDSATKILIAEDEMLVAEDLAISLENLGYIVTAKVSTGDEAVRMAGSSSPDVILMDIKLAGAVDGIQAADEIRSRFDIPVVYLTGYSEEDVIERAKLTEPYGCLAKPASIGELRSTIETVLHKYEADRRLRESEERYRSLVEQSIDGIVVVQRNTILFVNPALLEMFGCRSEQEMVGQSFLIFVAPEHRDLIEKRGREREEGGSPPSRYEFMALKKDGTRFSAELSVSVALYRGQRVRQGVVRDISDRKDRERLLTHSIVGSEQRLTDGATELVAATAALKENQSALRLITDSLPVLITYVDSEQRYRFCNKTYELWHGVSREQLEGRHLKEVLGEAAYEKARGYIEAALSGNPAEYEMALAYRDGKERCLHIVYVPHLDSRGQTTGFAGLITDITEQKKMETSLHSAHEELEQKILERTAEIADANEELRCVIASLRRMEGALRKEKEKADSYLDVAGVIILALDREGTVTLINRKGREILGYPPHEMIGTPWFDRYVPESDRERTKAEFLSMMSGEEHAAEYFENSVLTQTGEQRLIAWHNNLLTDADGTIVGTLSSGEDITERNRAEEALRQSEERFQLFMQHFPGLAYIKDASGRVLFANTAFAEYFGLDPATMIGKSNHDLFPASFAEKITADDRMVLHSGERYQIEESYDEHVWFTHKFPIPRTGATPLLGGLTLDITARKKSEQKIEASLKEKEVLLREIHHRVKNNLAIVSSLLRFQGRRVQSEQVSRIFEDIQNRIRSMALAHELLYQSDNLAGISLRAYASKLLNQLISSHSGVGRGIRISTELQDVSLGIDTVIPIGFILTELISNCLKHAFPEGRAGKITVSFRQLTDGEHKLVVKDDGVGMEAGIDTESLTSMGLDLVKIFVNQLAGHMEISRENGTQISIRLHER